VTAKRVPKVFPDILLSILSAMLQKSLFFAVQLRHGGVWRSLVAHLVWDQGVQGSNPCTPTKKLQGTAAIKCFCPFIFGLYFFVQKLLDFSFFSFFYYSKSIPVRSSVG
jgi:hypothetical protein